MAGVINTGSHPKLLWPGIHAIWGQVYAEHAKEYGELYTELDSDKAYEQDVEVTGFGLAPVKAQGAPVQYDSEFQGFVTTYSHVAYALGYIVTYEELRDNLYEEVSMRRAKANAFSINQTIENVAAFLYNNAFSTTYYTTADGAALISTSHLNASGGTWSNASFIRVTNSGTGTIGTFASFPAAAVDGVFRAKVGSPAVTHTIPVVSNGTTYYIMVSTIA